MSSAPRSGAILRPVRPILDREVDGHGQPFLLLLPRRDFGPFFLKFCTYFPYNAKLCINGHEYVKRQLARKGSPSRRWIMASSPAPTPSGCKRSATDSQAEKIDALLRKWLAYCRIRSPSQDRQPAIAMSCRSSRPSSR